MAISPMAISPMTGSPISTGPNLNRGFVNQFQTIDPQLILLLQYLLESTGGGPATSGAGAAFSPGAFNESGGFGNGGGFGAPSSNSGLGEFLGGSGISSSGAGQERSGGWVSGGDGYVPDGFETSGRGGAVGNSAQGAEAVSWAESQLGVSESNNPGAVRGYSRGAWQAWCADFVSTALNKAGANKMGHQSSVAGILSWGKANGRFTSAKAAAKNPGGLQIGDIATWKSAGKSHVGLVTGVDAKKGTFTTIEGNTSDKVARRSHSFNGKGLTGFVRATDSKKSTKSTASSAKSSSSRSASVSSSKESKGSSSSSKSGGEK